MSKRKLSLSVLAVIAATTFSAEVSQAGAAGAETQEKTPAASRVVSVGGSVTEILYALGLEKQVVAVDTTSVYPPEALKENPNVGYMRALSAEGVLALNPSLILAIEGSGPPDAMNVITSASTQLVSIPDHPTAEGIVNKIRTIAGAMNEAERGEKLATKITDEFAQLKQVTSELKSRARVMFILSLRGGRPVVAGSDTPADGILKLAGAENATGEFSGFKPMTDEAIIAAAPDAILMMSTPQHMVTADELFTYPALQATPAGKKKRLITMNGQYLLGFGPRTARAALDLAASLYPSIKKPDSAAEPNATSD